MKDPKVAEALAVALEVMRGGDAVSRAAMADLCEENGLDVPELREEEPKLWYFIGAFASQDPDTPGRPDYVLRYMGFDEAEAWRDADRYAKKYAREDCPIEEADAVRGEEDPKAAVRTYNRSARGVISVQPHFLRREYVAPTR